MNIIYNAEGKHFPGGNNGDNDPTNNEKKNNIAGKKATERECVCTCEVVAISAKHRGKAQNVPAKSHAKSVFPAFCTRITILFLAAFELGTMWPKYYN